MKSLYEYISEAVKVSAWKAGYKLVELVSRDKVDCANLTKEEFYNLMIQDLETAQDEYSRLVYDERKRNIEAIKKRKMDYIEKLVQARYKRKSNQDAYREKLLFKQGGLTDYDLNRDVNISFDFITKIDVGHPIDTLGITCGNFAQKLDGLWNELQRCEWWPYGQGWALCYIANKDGFLPTSYRSEIVLSMPDDKKAEKEARQKALDDALDHYYATNTYTGD